MGPKNEFWNLINLMHSHDSLIAIFEGLEFEVYKFSVCSYEITRRKRIPGEKESKQPPPFSVRSVVNWEVMRELERCFTAAFAKCSTAQEFELYKIPKDKFDKFLESFRLVPNERYQKHMKQILEKDDKNKWREERI
jgi:hypothetical protein